MPSKIQPCIVSETFGFWFSISSHPFNSLIYNAFEKLVSMASKVSPFILYRRLPICLSLSNRFYSSPCAAHVQNPPETNTSIPSFSEFEPAIRFLKNKLHPDRLIRVLDSTSDLPSAVRIFRWASSQRNFWQTPETYSHIILKLGVAGDHQEMESFLKELVRLQCPDAQEALGFLIHSFCQNNRLKEASRVLEIASLANYRLSVSTCNALLGAFDSEGGDCQAIMFVYKEMVKAGILPDVETLNYLMKALCETGCLDSALCQFHRMSKKQCAPNSRTFEMLISALCTSGRIDESVKIFYQMLELGCNPHLGFYNSIIPLFCGVNRFEEGNKLLRMMRDRDLSPDLYLYSVLIECLCENRQLDDAMELFEEMADSGLAPMTSMYIDIVSGYCNLGELSKAMSFLEENNTSEIEPYNALLKGYCDADRFPEAIGFLEKMAERGLTDGLSWNILIRGLCERCFVTKAFEVLGRMIVSSYIPDQATYSAIITGYCKLGAYDDALDKFRQACVSNMSLDSESCSELIEGLCCTKKIQEAAEVFYYIVGKGSRLTTNSLNILIQQICLMGKVEEAIRLRSLASHNSTSCIPLAYATIMLKLLELKKVKDILALFSQMLVEGCTLDVATYCLLIRGLCSESTAREAALLFDQMVHESFVPDPETLEVLIHCMAKCCRLHTIMYSLDKATNEEGLLTPTMCNMVVSGLLKEGHKHEACKLLDWMLDKGWVPDADTHDLLVGNTIEVYKNTVDDQVSNILTEGLENYDDRIVEE